MKLRPALFLVLGLAVAAPVWAADVEDTLKERAEARHDLERDAAREDYERAQANCDRLTGTDKEVCIKDARAAYASAKARADARKKAGESEAASAEDELEAHYKAERARCDQLAGARRDLCINDAKIKYRQ